MQKTVSSEVYGKLRPVLIQHLIYAALTIITSLPAVPEACPCLDQVQLKRLPPKPAPYYIQAAAMMMVRTIFLRLLSTYSLALHTDMGPPENVDQITVVSLTTKLTKLRLHLIKRQQSSI